MDPYLSLAGSKEAVSLCCILTGTVTGSHGEESGFPLTLVLAHHGSLTVLSGELCTERAGMASPSQQK